MIHFLRNLFASKLGVAITILFVAVIGLAFALGDVTNSGTFGGVQGIEAERYSRRRRGT